MTAPVASGSEGTAGPDVTAVASAVLGCSAVAGLDGGRFGEVATYLPGQRVSGVAFCRGRLIISVVGTSSATSVLLRGQIQAAASPLAPGVPIDVVFADIALDDSPAAAPRLDPPHPAPR